MIELGCSDLCHQIAAFVPGRLMPRIAVNTVSAPANFRSARAQRQAMMQVLVTRLATWTLGGGI